jgi:hypothetical protein
MLTLVFACQPLGQLAAALVALIAAARQRNGIPADATQFTCGGDTECTRTLDSIWRWIIGVGVFPAVIALWFRLTIIESPRYIADVARDSAKAASELKRYLMASPEMEFAFTTSIENENRNESVYQRAPVRRSTSSGARSGPQNVVEPESQQEMHPMSRRSSGAFSAVNLAEDEEHEAMHETEPLRRTTSRAMSVESGARSDDGIDPHNPPTEEHNLMQDDHAVAEGPSTLSPLPRGIESAQTGTYLATDVGSYRPGAPEPAFYQDDPEANLEFNMNRLSQQATKQLYMTTTGPALPGMSSNGKKAISADHMQPPAPSWEDFKDYFWHKGNLRTLIATSICWFCVDLPCKYIFRIPSIILHFCISCRPNHLLTQAHSLWPRPKFTPHNHENLVRSKHARSKCIYPSHPQRMAIPGRRIDRSYCRGFNHIRSHRSSWTKMDSNDWILLVIHSVYCYRWFFLSSL